MSRVISEIVLARIDGELKSRHRGLKGIRYIDDYEFVTPTRTKAEDVLSSLQQLLGEYDLTLNTAKTSIRELPTNLESEWTSSLRAFAFRDGGSNVQRSDLAAYFDLAFSLFCKFREDAVLKYALARLRRVEIHLENWLLLENILLHCLIVDPGSLDMIVELVVKYRHRVPIRSSEWASALNRVVVRELKLGHASEAAWAMWLMLVLSVRLSVTSALEVSKGTDSVTALMGIQLVLSNLAERRRFSGLRRFTCADEVVGRHWLLCYELAQKEFFAGTPDYQGKHADAFSIMRRSGVSFMNNDVPSVISSAGLQQKSEAEY